MSIPALAAILAYAFSLLLRWYRNYSIVGGWPFILRSKTKRSIFRLVIFVLTYGGIIGIGYFFGIWAALVALAIKLIVGRLSFHYHFKQVVKVEAEWEYQQMLKDRANADVPLEELDTTDRVMRMFAPSDKQMDELAMRQEANRRAREAIQNRVMRG